MFSKYIDRMIETGRKLIIPELTEKEKEVIKHLAEKGPMCGYDFHLGGQKERGSRKALMSSGYWHKVLNHIGPDGDLKLITLVKLNKKIKKPDNALRGRRKDLYYLTLDGVIAALELDKKLLSSIKSWDRRIFGDKSVRVYILELIEIVGVEWAFRILSRQTSLMFGSGYVDLCVRMPLTPEKIEKLEGLDDSFEEIMIPPKTLRA